MGKHKDIEVVTFAWSRSWGLCGTSADYAADGAVCSRSGYVIDRELGYVKGQIRLHTDGVVLHAHAGYGGRSLVVSQVRTGAFSSTALSRWLWKHAIPAMKAEVGIDG